MANVVITTHWSDGDVLPFIEIGKYLLGKGHKVTILTHCIYKKLITEQHMEFEAWDTMEEYERLMNFLADYNDILSDQDNIEKFYYDFQNANLHLRELSLLEKYCAKEKTVIIAKNRSSVAALAAAEKYHCSLIWVYMNPYEYGSLINFNLNHNTFITRQANIFRKMAGLKPIHSWMTWQNVPKLKLALYPSWYKSSVAPQPEGMIMAGFPLQTKQKLTNIKNPELLELLRNSEKKPILITGGTSKKLRNDFYKRAMEACALYTGNVIVACKYKEFLPKELPENCYIFDYIPLYDCMQYCAMVIHHGGIGTASNAIYAGVPQLILGDLVDRPLNGAIVQKLGIGRYLPPIQWTTQEIWHCIQELLSDYFKKKCDRFVKEHREEDNAFLLIESIVRKCSENSQYQINLEQIEKTSEDMKVMTQEDKEVLNKNNLDNTRKYLLHKLKQGRESNEKRIIRETEGI